MDKTECGSFQHRDFDTKGFRNLETGTEWCSKYLNIYEPSHPSGWRLSRVSRGVVWSFRLGTHRKEGRKPLGGLGKMLFFFQGPGNAISHVYQGKVSYIKA